MSATADADLDKLKAEAEAQQRRRAPDLAGQEPSKRRKLEGSAAEQEDEDAGGAIGRFTYAAADAVAAGSTCLMASCGFNRQRSAAKELLSIVKPLLPEGTQLQMVKVGCRGLAVVRLEPPAPVIDLLGQVLDQIQSGQLQHTKFVERIIPAETTCLLTSVALEAALIKAVQAFLAGRQQQQQQQGQDAGGAADSAAAAADKQGPVEYAVMYKSRGVDKQILAEMEREAVRQQQQQQQQGQGQQEQEQEQGPKAGAAVPPAASSQEPQQQQQQAAGGGSVAPAVQGLDRQRIIDMAAAVMDSCCKEAGGAKVNLKAPQVVVMVEVVPLLREAACAVAVLPCSLMAGGQKLKIKATSAADGGDKEGGGGGGGGVGGGGGGGRKKKGGGQR